MADYPQRHEVPTVNLSGRDLTVNGNTVNIPLPGESGSIISDGTNAIDAAGNTYTNGVKSGKLRARNDRIWGEYGYSEPEASEPGVTINEINFIFPGNTQIQFSYDNHSWVQYVTYEIDENDWTSITGIGPSARNESMLDWDYDFSFDVTRHQLFDRFALESQLPGSGSNLDTNTVAEIANHAISTNATVSGLTSQVSSLSSSKRDVDDNEFNGHVHIESGSLELDSPFGIAAHYLSIGTHDTFDEGWSSLSVTTGESTETLPEYLDRRLPSSPNLRVYDARAAAGGSARWSTASSTGPWRNKP